MVRCFVVINSRVINFYGCIVIFCNFLIEVFIQCVGIDFVERLIGSKFGANIWKAVASAAHDKIILSKSWHLKDNLSMFCPHRILSHQTL